MVCEYISSVLDQEVRGLKYLIGSQSFPSYSVATKLNYSSDSIRRLNFTNKIKIKIESKKFLLKHYNQKPLVVGRQMPHLIA